MSRWCWSCALALAALTPSPGASPLPAPGLVEPVATQRSAGGEHPDAEIPSGSVEIDGVSLFRVRGTSTFPPEERVAAIEGRIEQLARDASWTDEPLELVEGSEGTEIRAHGERLMTVLDADASLESIDRKALARDMALRIRRAVADYRESRTAKALGRSALFAGAALALAALLWVLVLRLSRRLQGALERLVLRHTQTPGMRSLKLIRSDQAWGIVSRLLTILRVVGMFLIALACLDYVLGRFPWTRGVAEHLTDWALEPLRTMGRGAMRQLPNLLFLVVAYFVIRGLLIVVHAFYRGLERGEIVVHGFEREWAEPTYKLVRLLIVVLGLVVCYPYIPGSGTDAFKGITLLIGVLFSLGSSSAVANIVAGYMITYRRAFRLGDRVRIGDHTGDVTNIGLQATHLRTVKNEDVIVPNSTILNTDVVNYSSLAREQGLLLHTTVGIGYETPWRQAEELLLMAASRTPGIRQTPAPFVNQLSLGDFAVVYEINVACEDARAMPALYTALHRNILDCFNEYGVQIMTPAYVSDPGQPKLVPTERWFTPPARPRSEGPPPKG